MRCWRWHRSRPASTGSTSWCRRRSSASSTGWPTTSACWRSTAVASFAYESTYFDDASLSSYLAAAHGRPSRYKVRTRTYVDSGECMLEVKRRSGRGETVKERVPYPTADSGLLTAAGTGVRGDRGAVARRRRAASRAAQHLRARHAGRPPGRCSHDLRCRPRLLGSWRRRRPPRRLRAVGDEVARPGHPGRPGAVERRRPTGHDQQVLRRSRRARPRPAGQQVEPDAAPLLRLDPCPSRHSPEIEARNPSSTSGCLA